MPAPARGFFAAWQGTPPFDAAALMRWTGTLYDRYAGFFGQKAPPPYGVFLRYNPINAGGGGRPVPQLRHDVRARGWPGQRRGRDQIHAGA
ncbi:MAG: hypothetical protein PGN08_05975 [Sphingomonas taxi]